MSIDRTDVKQQIHEAINAGKRTIILCAPGGYGKSFIAREYCEHSVLRHPAFLSAKGDIRSQLKSVFQLEYPNADLHEDMLDGVFADYLYSQLDAKYEKDNSKWVITYDDIELGRRDFGKFVRDFIYVPRKGYLAKGIVIITTQNSWEYSDRNVEVINVPKVSEDIARSYLKETIDEITENDIENILAATGCIALPLSIAGASIVRKARLRRIHISAAVTEYCNAVATAQADFPNDIDYDNNLYNAILVTVGNIYKCENDPCNVYDLLMCSAMTAPIQFERQALFTELLNIENWENAQSALAGWHLFENAYSFTMHPTTQDVLLYIDFNSDREAFFERLYRASKAFINLCEASSHKDGCIVIHKTEAADSYSSELETAKRLEMLLHNAVKQAKASRLYSELYKMLYAVSYGIAFYYYKHTNNFKDRERYYYYAYKAADVISKDLPIDSDWHFRKAAQLKYRGVSLRALDKNEDAIKCYDEALDLYNNIGENKNDIYWHRLAVEIYYNRGLAKSDKGNHTDVLEDYNKSARIAKVHGFMAPVSLRCLGIYYRDTGDYESAEKSFMESIKLGNKENEARCYTNLGLMYSMIGKWKESEEYSRKAIDILKRLKGQAENDPLLNLEFCLRLKDEKDEAGAKQCLVDASVIIFGNGKDSLAHSIHAILDGTNEEVTLDGKDYHWDKIGCMLLCTHCIEYLLSVSDNVKSNKNIKRLVDMAFEVRDSSFKKLRNNILSIKEENPVSLQVIEEKVKTYTEDLKYNKLTCAVLMLACAEYYNKCDEVIKAIAFAYAAYYLYDAYNYAYGREASRELICQLKNSLSHD